jgi:hypothetical protein
MPFPPRHPHLWFCVHLIGHLRFVMSRAPGL